MIRRFADDGVKVCLWEVPYLAAETAAYREARERGFLLLGPDGAPTAQIDGAFRPTSSVGWWTSPTRQAATWWQDLHRPLLAMGIAAFKTDFGEGVPPTRARTPTDRAATAQPLPAPLQPRGLRGDAGARGIGLIWGRFRLGELAALPGAMGRRPSDRPSSASRAACAAG
jgi:alpha-D-xyloside xylohydrolase